MTLEQWLDGLVQRLKRLGLADASWSLTDAGAVAQIKITRANGTEITCVVGTKQVRLKRTDRSKNHVMSSVVRNILYELHADGTGVDDTYIKDDRIEKWMDELVSRLEASDLIEKATWEVESMRRGRLMYPFLDLAIVTARLEKLGWRIASSHLSLTKTPAEDLDKEVELIFKTVRERQTKKVESSARVQV